VLVTVVTVAATKTRVGDWTGMTRSIMLVWFHSYQLSAKSPTRDEVSVLTNIF